MPSEAKKYHAYARECLQQVEKANKPETRDKLLELSRVWLEATLREDGLVLQRSAATQATNCVSTVNSASAGDERPGKAANSIHAPDEGGDFHMGGCLNSIAESEESLMNPQSLSDAEFERVHEALKRFGGKRTMNFEQIDGFLAALISGHMDVPRIEYLPQIWGDNIVNEDAFQGQPILQDFVSLITRHRDAITHTLRSGAVYTPLLLEDQDGVARGNDWANGFVRGMELRKQHWARIVDDDDNGGSLVPIFALAHEHDPDPEMRSYDKPVSPELREKLIIGAAAGVMRIYRYFQERRFVAAHPAGDNTIHRSFPKIGRNEPCPCGSGKKYKQCCGRITTLH